MFSFLESFSDHVGIIGVVLTIIAYYLINTNRVTSQHFAYVWLNLVGATLLLYSLCFHWNLACVLIEIAWIAISLIGLYQTMMSRQQVQEKQEEDASNNDQPPASDSL
jgi:multisubunit Na+/H+ antiporter MnhB subunit